MPNAALFLIDGFEETEAIVTLDILRRADVDVRSVSLMKRPMVMGKHNIEVKADALYEEFRAADFDMLVIPGGTTAYFDHRSFLDMLPPAHQSGIKIAAICAAPAILGKLGLLKGKEAVCYPGMESYLEGAVLSQDVVVTDETITTGKGPGATIAFALRLVEILQGQACAKQVAADFVVSV